MANQEELVEKLIKEDENFRRVYTTHKTYGKKIEEMEKKARLSADETLEKKRLKKLKLALKDEMEKILSEHKK
ncbi:MAG TPA: DUF465 domain-containing protein [Thermodesulfobacteriota bacterium]|nr:DUF465 domain-containing protein [Thermodesulfobacteriota bacterium]